MQDTWQRWTRSAPEQLDAPAARLRRTATRIAIDELRSARRRRERSYGPWLPEPILETEDIALVFTNMLRKAVQEEHARLSVGRANGRPCLLRHLGDRLDAVFTLAPTTDARAGWIYVMRNPEKLGCPPHRGSKDIAFPDPHGSSTP